MSIIRVKKEQKYFVAANEPFQDKNLSWEARGVMGYLLSKPDGWECRNYDLVNQGPAGEHTIKRIVKELRENGYVYRFKVSKGRGKIEWVTEIYETPELNPNFTNGDFTTVENTTVDTIEVEKSADIVSTDSQKVLNTEKTDSNGSAKKSQNKNGQDGFDRADQAERDNLNTLADAIAKVCGNINMNTVHPKTRDELKQVTLSLYGQSVTPDDLIAFGVWWYNEPWQGKKGQPPTLKQLGDMWGQFEAAQSAPASTATGPVLSDVAKENYARLLAQQTK